MIPIRDVIPSRTTPFVTIGIIGLNAGAFVYEQSLPAAQLQVFISSFGLVPAAFSPTAVVTSMFLHGGWLHFLGNSLYPWIFGDNVEDHLGHERFLLFYLVCGTAAALAQTGVTPNSTVLPIFFFIQIIEVPAIFFLGFWFLMQLMSGMGSLDVQTGADIGGVAFWAHIAGFAAGVVGIFVTRRPKRRRPTR